MPVVISFVALVVGSSTFVLGLNLGIEFGVQGSVHGK